MHGGTEKALNPSVARAGGLLLALGAEVVYLRSQRKLRKVLREKDQVEHRQARCEMKDLSVAMDLMKCFHGSFINHNGEFIAHRYGEAYFNFSTCEDVLDVKCKVLEWLSRPASKGQPFKSNRANERYQNYMLDGINKYLGTHFTHDDIDEVYTYLGNRCNHTKTIRFIESGYDVGMLPVRGED